MLCFAEINQMTNPTNNNAKIMSDDETANRLTVYRSKYKYIQSLW